MAEEQSATTELVSPPMLPTATAPISTDPNEESPVVQHQHQHQHHVRSPSEQPEENTRSQPRQFTARTVYHQRRADDDTLNSTRSLYDSNVVYIDIHGRRYCKDYYMPNDVVEQERLQMLNGVFHFVLGHRLTTVPLKNPEKILDVGTGTGEWAMAMGEEFPEAEVIGTDIAKIQPSAAPLNVFFEIDDAEVEGGWMWPDDEFDLVHFRYMKGAFLDWKYIYNEAYKHLKPGGWVEVLDFDDHKRIQGFFAPDSGVPRWIHAIDEGTEILGRSRSIAHLEPEYLIDLGFVDVESKVYKIPVGVWPDDPEAQAVGKHFLIAILNGMEAFCLRVLVEQMGWKLEEIQKVLEEIGEATWSIATNPEKAQGMAFEIKVLTGRKPGW